MSKETLRKYLLTSSAEAIPQARPSLLSCFTNAENPKPQLQDRLSAAGEALESCSETALQSWFDPLEILLDQEAGTLAVRFPHAFFGIRFSSLFQKLFEKKARELWGKGLSITYGAGKFTPSPPVPFVQPAPESRQDALHPAVANPMPFGEEWTFDTFIGNGKHKWALSLARDITRRAVYRATHGRAPSLDDISEARACWCLRPSRDRQDPSVGPLATNSSARSGRSLLQPDDLCCYSPGVRSSPPGRNCSQSVLIMILAPEPYSRQDAHHGVGSAPDCRRAGAAQASLRGLCLLLDRFMDQGKPVIVAGVGRPKEWSLGKALLSRLETGLWAELPEPDLDVRLRYAQQQAKFRRLPLSREQLLLIAQHCPDVRRLSGVILRVASHRSLLGRDLSEQDLLNIVRQGGDSSALTPQLI
ncbi:MAG: chromosomal replication initiator DnaA, partial [Bilophila wadsworthia]